MQHINHPIAEELLENRQYKRLLHQHEQLEAQLTEQQSGPLVDWDGVRLVKVKKLRIAEELERLRRVHH